MLPLLVWVAPAGISAVLAMWWAVSGGGAGSKPSKPPGPPAALAAARRELGNDGLECLSSDHDEFISLLEIRRRLTRSPAEQGIFGELVQHIDQIECIASKPSTEKADMLQDVFAAHNHSIQIDRLLKKLQKAAYEADPSASKLVVLREHGSILKDNLTDRLAFISHQLRQVMESGRSSKN